MRNRRISFQEYHDLLYQKALSACKTCPQTLKIAPRSEKSPKDRERYLSTKKPQTGANKPL